VRTPEERVAQARTFDRAAAEYEAGRPQYPPELAEWKFQRGGWLQVYEQPQRAGTGSVTLAIRNMENQVARLQKLGVDTSEVLAAAGTKWNFLKFTPGLVGGHCIGVDPYYLTHKAEALGYHPEVILAGRRINDGMGGYVARELIKELIRRGAPVNGARVLVMGLAFKENTPDLRNTRVIDIVRELADYQAKVEVWDPWIAAEDARGEYGVDLVDAPEAGAYDAVVLAVAHRQFAELGPAKIRGFGKAGAVLFDVKGMLPRAAADLRL